MSIAFGKLQSFWIIFTLTVKSDRKNSCLVIVSKSFSAIWLKPKMKKVVIISNLHTNMFAAPLFVLGTEIESTPDTKSILITF